MSMIENVSLGHRLRALSDVMARDGNVDIADRVGRMADRAQAEQQVIQVAFCGLFSAGKSSLLNYLSGSDALATGAVPTTALVQSVVIPETDQKVIALDTPGIDSTDDSHQAATEAVLFEADVVALVMDYQHVEAEENLELAHAFSAQGKRLLLVVNQVDKHVNWELPFSEYQRRIERIFSDWDISYEGLYYTATVPCAWNEVDQLAAALRTYGTSTEHRLGEAAKVSVHELIRNHVDWLYEADLFAANDVIAKAMDLVPMDTDEAVTMMSERSASLQTILLQRQQEMATARAQVEAERQGTLRMIELAQIAPYETTERGRQYVESLHPDFRVGWLGQKAKTAQEQAVRMERFLKDLADLTMKNLLLPIKNHIRDLVLTRTSDANWQGKVDAILLDIDANLLARNVNAGALTSDTYPYQFVRDVVAQIKRQMSAQVSQFFSDWEQELVADMDTKKNDTVSEEQLTLEITALKRWLDVQDERQARIERLIEMIEIPVNEEDQSGARTSSPS